MRTNVVAIYNTNNELVVNTSVLNIEYNQIKNTNPVHIEYELIPEGSVDGFLSADLYQKMIDSLPKQTVLNSGATGQIMLGQAMLYIFQTAVWGSVPHSNCACGR